MTAIGSETRGKSVEQSLENLFAKCKDWRRIATRYDRCAHAFFSAVCIAAAIAFYSIQ